MKHNEDHDMPRSRLLVALMIVPVLAALPASAIAGMLRLTLDTSSLAGTPAALAFDLVRGDASDNTMSIVDFSTDGSLGSASSTGGPVSGALPGLVTLGDEAFFNELLQNIGLASAISFTLSFSENFSAPTPTSFALFMLDDSAGLPLFPTSDPTGANALFALDLDGTQFGDYRVFEALGPLGITVTATPVTPGTPGTPVPEPASLLLFAVGLFVFIALPVLTAQFAWDRPSQTALRIRDRGRARNCDG